MKEVMIDHARTSELHHHFSSRLDPEGTATSQGASGRCWLFAACNEIRLSMMKKLDLPLDFELSQPFLFFWDKLEKANYFLRAILQTASMPEDSRVVQHLLTAPVQDGGQYTMFSNIVRKYGLVPKDAYPETFHTRNSRDMRKFITTKLRAFAATLRESVAPLFSDKDKQPSLEELLEHTEKLRQEMIGVIYRILAVCLGTPPKDFVWRYTTKGKKTFVKHKRMTPLEFAKEMVPFDITNRVSLVNDPRNEYFKTYTVEKLGNIVEGDSVLYLNVPMDTIRKQAKAMIDDKKPVWFGCDFGHFYNRDSGVLDVRQYDYDSVFGTNPLSKTTKASRLRFHESAMTHAMLFTGYDLDDDDASIRGWRVENSHSVSRGNKGYIIMTDEWFDEFLYQIVVDVDRLPDEFKKVLADVRDGKVKPTVLPPWDPMGALAKL